MDHGVDLQPYAYATGSRSLMVARRTIEAFSDQVDLWEDSPGANSHADHAEEDAQEQRVILRHLERQTKRG